MRINNKIYLGFALIVYVIFVYFVKSYLNPIIFIPQNPIFASLISKSINVSFYTTLFFGCINMVFIYKISGLFFKKYNLVPVALYAISPWIIYLTAVNSFFVFLLFTILIIIYGLVLINSENKSGLPIFVVGTLLAFYSYSLMVIIIPCVLGLSILFKLITFKSIKRSLIFIGIFSIPLIFLILLHPRLFINDLSSQITIFSDPGLLNNVNVYQGASQEEGLYKLSKLSENRYLFSLYYSFVKFTKHVIPSTYFTYQEKLLGFSVSPPFYLGLVIPFIYSLLLLLKSPKFRKVLIVVFILLIPSFLAKPLVDINRLILIMPLLLFMISYGLIKLYEGDRLKRFFLWITIILVIGQLLLTICDVRTKEKVRYIKYFGENYQLKL